MYGPSLTPSGLSFCRECGAKMLKDLEKNTGAVDVYAKCHTLVQHALCVFQGFSRSSRYSVLGLRRSETLLANTLEL